MTEYLTKGENISLSKLAPQLTDVILSVKWFKKENDTSEYDIDSSAFLLTEKNKVRNDNDFIFYNQPNSIDNSVILKNSLFKISLNHISQEIRKLSFSLTLHEGKQKKQYFGLLDKIIVELLNFSDKQKLISYSLDNIETETALVLASLYRHNNEWKFKAVGQGYNEGLGILAKSFGVNIEEDSQPQLEQPIANESLTPATLVGEKALENGTAANPQKIKKQITEKKSESNEIDIHNTDFMTKEDHYQPIVDWFKNKHFVADVNPDAMDTSGFFDEIAVELGDNYDLLKIVSNAIKRRQMADKRTAYIHFENANYTLKQTERIKKFCKQLYAYSFVAKYFYDKNKNEIVLHLQSATKIVNFFNGEWLEWYAFMKIATFCHKRKINFSCTRNIIINLPDNSKYELDVFCLIDGMPLFIECKSGEYRQFIDKYSRLRRKMLIDKEYFLFLVLGETDGHIKGLTSMFDLTFINEKMLANYCEEIFLKDS